jgi:hypothetical protein
MSSTGRAIYVSERVWRAMDSSVRAEVMKHMTRKQVVSEYACNTENALRSFGEHEAAAMFLQGVKDACNALDNCA